MADQTQTLEPLAAQLATQLGEAFAAIGLDAQLGLVRRSDRPDLADFQCNGAMAAAKQARRPPREIASAIIEHLGQSPQIARAELAGPGFINIIVSDTALAQRAETIRTDPKAGGGLSDKPETLMLDFGGLNVAKPMHVGHLRSLIIGESLQRLLRFRGHRLISDVHLGDWGLQMGMLITGIEAEMPDLPWFKSEDTPLPDASPVTLADLERIYPQAAAAAKSDAQYLQRARLATARLQDGDAAYRALWRHFIEVTREALEEEFAILGVHFDLWKGESDAQALIPDMLAKLEARGLAHMHEDALIFPVAQETDSKEYPPLILRNARGASTYHTTDMATIIARIEDYNKPDRMLYVVDQRQALHFEQVFRACDAAGYMRQDRLEHIGFGTMNGPDGKPFRTREGGVLKLRDLLDQARKAAQERLEEAGIAARLERAECAEIVQHIAMAAIKFADLSNIRTTNYVFDLKKFTAFEGCTGPYLLYAAVRIQSLLRRAEAEGLAVSSTTVRALSTSEERAIALALDGFSHMLAEAERKRAPHLICAHIYSLAQAFSAFYAKCPILNEADKAVRLARLGLAQAVLHQLKVGLSLIGLSVPERM